MNSLLQVLDQWLTVCNDFACTDVVLTGTAALRRASNTQELLDHVKDRTDLGVRILTPTNELQAVYEAVAGTFPRVRGLAVLNLGGGSTQVGVGDSDLLHHGFELDFGTRELTERWPWAGPFAAPDYDNMLEHVSRRVRQFISPFDLADLRVVHTGGELDFMLRCILPLSLCSLSPVHVSEISVDAFATFARDFASLDPGVVTSRFSLDPAWASGAVASNTFALAVARALNATAIAPSNYNISDGLLRQTTREPRQ